MDHRIYGIIIFVGIILLIYLLNYNQSNNSLSLEGFEGESTSSPTSTLPLSEQELLSQYYTYDNTFIDLSNKIAIPQGSTALSLADALTICNRNQNAIGLTKDKTVINTYYLILKNNYCKTRYMGSDLEKDKAGNFKTFIKNTIKNSDIMCLNDDSFDKRYISIGGNYNLCWMVGNDDKIESVDLSKLNATGKYINSRFKIVKGLGGTNTISFKYVENGKPDRYIVNDYPKKSYLFLREINSNEFDWKNKASFRISPSLTYNSSDNITNNNKNKYSLKIMGFPNMYIIANEISKNFLNIVSSESLDVESYNKTDFMFLAELTKDTISEIEKDLIPSNEMNEVNNDLSPSNKLQKMKTTNLYTLDKQTNLLDNQTNMMNAYDFIHKNNMSNISREFANQSAILALSKYFEEKENMKKITSQGLPDNTPSVSSMKPTS